VGCDDPVPEHATVSLRSLREGVEECIGYWPVAAHPNPSQLQYVYDPHNYLHETTRLSREEFIAWGREAKKEEPLQKMPPQVLHSHNT
jgi:hypothetical protein